MSSDFSQPVDIHYSLAIGAINHAISKDAARAAPS